MKDKKESEGMHTERRDPTQTGVDEDLLTVTQSKQETCSVVNCSLLKPRQFHSPRSEDPFFLGNPETRSYKPETENQKMLFREFPALFFCFAKVLFSQDCMFRR